MELLETLEAADTQTHSQRKAFTRNTLAPGLGDTPGLSKVLKKGGGGVFKLFPCPLPKETRCLLEVKC